MVRLLVDHKADASMKGGLREGNSLESFSKAFDEGGRRERNSRRWQSVNNMHCFIKRFGP